MPRALLRMSSKEGHRVLPRGSPGRSRLRKEAARPLRASPRREQSCPGKGCCEKEGRMSSLSSRGIASRVRRAFTKVQKAFQHRGWTLLEPPSDAAVRAASGSRLDGRHFGPDVARRSSRKSVRTRVLDRVRNGCRVRVRLHVLRAPYAMTRGVVCRDRCCVPTGHALPAAETPIRGRWLRGIQER
jgi:hypothetical protein